MKLLRRVLLIAIDAGYTQLARRYLFRASAVDAHRKMMQALPFLDRFGIVLVLLAFVRRLTFNRKPVEVGGVTLDHPFVLAAGLIKGIAFPDEAGALAAVQAGHNIIPGWRSVPRLMGAVEFGSFTRWPRVGNFGVVLWRDAESRSTQNRMGLPNPGANAAAAFLAAHRDALPPQFGINIAVSPGVSDSAEQEKEIVDSLTAFLSRGVVPSWFTLNLSCPNTEDDPAGNQTESLARRLCGAVVDRLRELDAEVPLWVKVGPGLSRAQYRTLMGVFHEVGVRAVIATNTLSQPAPDGSGLAAGVGGGHLHAAALLATGWLMLEKVERGYDVDVIGCGGILDGTSYHNFAAWDVKAVQYWSALIYRGPLAAATIESELPGADAKLANVYVGGESPAADGRGGLQTP